MPRSRYWTAAATKFYEEQRAAYHVEKQGFQFYLPQVLMRKGSRNYREFLFPGYIFIKISAGWESIMHTRGIRRMFLCAGVPTRMSERDIDGIRARENEDGYIELEPPIVVGSKVEIHAGSFKDLFGVVEYLSSSERCRVLVSMMERAISVEMDTSSIKVAAR